MKIKRITEITPELIAHLNQTFMKGEPDGKSGEWDLENAINFVKNPNNIFLLAFVDGQIAGMITAYRLERMDRKKAEMFFYEIGVTKNRRRQGVGRALVMELLQIGKEMEVTEIFVFTNKSNIPAMTLYESTGGKSSKRADDAMFTYNLQ